MQRGQWRYFAFKSEKNKQMFASAATESFVEPTTHFPGNWQQAFHGTWFYGLWNILANDYISASADASLGHEYNRLGALVYMSPLFGTAKSYGRNQILFFDGVYHTVVLELRVNVEKRKNKKSAGGVQWTFESEDCYICGVWFGHNVGNPAGREHLATWNPSLEALPRFATEVRVI